MKPIGDGSWLILKNNKRWSGRNFHCVQTYLFLFVASLFLDPSINTSFCSKRKWLQNYYLMRLFCHCISLSHSTTNWCMLMWLGYDVLEENLHIPKLIVGVMCSHTQNIWVPFLLTIWCDVVVTGFELLMVI